MSLSTSRRPGISVFMLWIAKPKCVPLVNGTKRIKQLEKQTKQKKVKQNQKIIPKNLVLYLQENPPYLLSFLL